eukprot:COSAG01_NODE_31552_length_595_cov_2.276210_1_plen_60_part_01
MLRTRRGRRILRHTGVVVIQTTEQHFVVCGEILRVARNVRNVGELWLKMFGASVVYGEIF